MITYIATNTENGKFYIGSTTNFERRQREHLTTSQEFYFQRALRRNPDLFNWEVHEDDSEDPVLEQALLDMWYGKKQCYNMSGFAQRPPDRKGEKLKPDAYEKLVTRLKSNPPMKGKQQTEETKNKISQKLQGNTVPDEVREKISVTLTGKKKSPEHCAAISRGRREKVKPKESKAYKWLPEIIIWRKARLSLRSIGKIIGVSHPTISRLLKQT